VLGINSETRVALRLRLGSLGIKPFG
jgi:hypothetical protein